MDNFPSAVGKQVISRKASRYNLRSHANALAQADAKSATASPMTSPVPLTSADLQKLGNEKPAATQNLPKKPNNAAVQSGRVSKQQPPVRILSHPSIMSAAGKNQQLQPFSVARKPLTEHDDVRVRKGHVANAAAAIEARNGNLDVPISLRPGTALPAMSQNDMNDIVLTGPPTIIDQTANADNEQLLPLTRQPARSSSRIDHLENLVTANATLEGQNFGRYRNWDTRIVKWLHETPPEAEFAENVDFKDGKTLNWRELYATAKDLGRKGRFAECHWENRE